MGLQARGFGIGPDSNGPVEYAAVADDVRGDETSRSRASRIGARSTS